MRCFGGLSAKVFRQDLADDDRRVIEEVLAAGFDQIEYNGIRPELDFPNGTPATLTGPDIVDRLTSIMFPNRSQNSR